MKKFIKDWFKLFFWLLIIVLIPAYLLHFIVGILGLDPMKDAGAFKIINMIVYIPNMIFIVVGAGIMLTLSVVVLTPVHFLFGSGGVTFLTNNTFVCSSDGMFGCLFPGIGGILIFSVILVLFLKIGKFIFKRKTSQEKI